eukprot:SAG25_NODE_104_length_15398_cov_15.424472_1_plen_1868_part_00
MAPTSTPRRGAAAAAVPLSAPGQWSASMTPAHTGSGWRRQRRPRTTTGLNSKRESLARQQASLRDAPTPPPTSALPGAAAVAGAPEARRTAKPPSATGAGTRVGTSAGVAGPRVWELADGDPAPLVDVFLRYSTRTTASAIADLRALERREAAQRAKTKAEVSACRDRLATIVGRWDAAAGQLLTRPADLRALHKALGGSMANAIVQYEALDKWHTAFAEADEVGGMEDEMYDTAELLKTRGSVRAAANKEVDAERTRVAELADLNRIMNRQLAEVRAQVHELNHRLDETKGTGTSMIAHWHGLSAELQVQIKAAQREIEKAVHMKHSQTNALAEARQEMKDVQEEQRVRQAQHETEMVRLQALLERLQKTHEQQLQRDRQNHEEKLAEGRAAMQVLISEGVQQPPDIDIEVLRAEARATIEQEADRRFLVDMEDLKQKRARLLGSEKKLELDLMQHVEEVEQAKAELANAMEKAANEPEELTSATDAQQERLADRWRRHRSEYYAWKKKVGLAARLPCMGVQTMKVMQQRPKTEAVDAEEHPMKADEEAGDKEEPDDADVEHRDGPIPGQDGPVLVSADASGFADEGGQPSRKSRSKAFGTKKQKRREKKKQNRQSPDVQQETSAGDEDLAAKHAQDKAEGGGGGGGGAEEEEELVEVEPTEEEQPVEANEVVDGADEEEHSEKVPTELPNEMQATDTPPTSRELDEAKHSMVSTARQAARTKRTIVKGPQDLSPPASPPRRIQKREPFKMPKPPPKVRVDAPTAGYSRKVTKPKESTVKVFEKSAKPPKTFVRPKIEIPDEPVRPRPKRTVERVLRAPKAASFADDLPAVPQQVQALPVPSKVLVAGGIREREDLAERLAEVHKTLEVGASYADNVGTTQGEQHPSELKWSRKKAVLHPTTVPVTKEADPASPRQGWIQKNSMVMLLGDEVQLQNGQRRWRIMYTYGVAINPDDVLTQTGWINEFEAAGAKRKLAPQGPGPLGGHWAASKPGNTAESEQSKAPLAQSATAPQQPISLEDRERVKVMTMALMQAQAKDNVQAAAQLEALQEREKACAELETGRDMLLRLRPTVQKLVVQIDERSKMIHAEYEQLKAENGGSRQSDLAKKLDELATMRAKILESLEHFQQHTTRAEEMLKDFRETQWQNIFYLHNKTGNLPQPPQIGAADVKGEEKSYRLPSQLTVVIPSAADASVATPKRRKFTLKVATGDDDTPAVDIYASTLQELQRKVRDTLGLDPGLEMKLSLENFPEEMETEDSVSFSPRPMTHSLSSLKSPASGGVPITVWTREPEDAGDLDDAQEGSNEAEHLQPNQDDVEKQQEQGQQADVPCGSIAAFLALQQKTAVLMAQVQQMGQSDLFIADDESLSESPTPKVLHFLNRAEDLLELLTRVQEYYAERAQVWAAAEPATVTAPLNEGAYGNVVQQRLPIDLLECMDPKPLLQYARAIGVPPGEIDRHSDVLEQANPAAVDEGAGGVAEDEVSSKQKMSEIVAEIKTATITSIINVTAEHTAAADDGKMTSKKNLRSSSLKAKNRVAVDAIFSAPSEPFPPPVSHFLAASQELLMSKSSTQNRLGAAPLVPKPPTRPHIAVPGYEVILDQDTFQRQGKNSWFTKSDVGSGAMTIPLPAIGSAYSWETKGWSASTRDERDQAMQEQLESELIAVAEALMAGPPGRQAVTPRASALSSSYAGTAERDQVGYSHVRQFAVSAPHSGTRAPQQSIATPQETVVFSAAHDGYVLGSRCAQRPLRMRLPMPGGMTHGSLRPGTTPAAFAPYATAAPPTFRGHSAANALFMAKRQLVPIQHASMSARSATGRADHRIVLREGFISARERPRMATNSRPPATMGGQPSEAALTALLRAPPRLRV